VVCFYLLSVDEDSSLGRLVNDDHKHQNCKMKKVVAENTFSNRFANDLFAYGCVSKY